MGEVKVTRQTERVLEALLTAPGEYHYGFELSRVTGLRSGTLYPILARLEGVGILESDWEDGEPARKGPRRRFYRFASDGADRARCLLAENELRRMRAPVRYRQPALESRR